MNIMKQIKFGIKNISTNGYGEQWHLTGSKTSWLLEQVVIKLQKLK
jgi:hypothetical protein